LDFFVEKRPIYLDNYIKFIIFATSIIIMTNQNNYIPAPVDTTDVQLPEELMALAEAISKNVHEVWAQNRIKEGWTYGPVRDDAKRQTPCLVPYEQLPEEEKAYDRNTAFGTLKFIVSQGFEIHKT
jgi:hypothetical protein